MILFLLVVLDSVLGSLKDTHGAVFSSLRKGTKNNIFAVSVSPTTSNDVLHLAHNSPVSPDRQNAWRIVRSLVVGYIAEKEPSAAAEEEEENDEVGTALTNPFVDDQRRERATSTRVLGKSGPLFTNRQSLGFDHLASNLSTTT